MKTKMLFSNIAPSAALALATVLAASAVTVLLTQPLQAGYPEWVQIQTDPESTPVGREAHAMVYDEQRGVVVLHGGVKEDRRNPGPDDILSDTWEWNGADWKRVSTTGPATFWHGMAYDASRGVTVLYGGRDPEQPPAQKIALRNTWEWNGESWMKIEGGQGEVGLYSPAMAYDPARAKVIRHGGTSSGDGFGHKTTWAWDGQTWSEIANDGPARGEGNLIYDAVRESMVLFGGLTGIGDAFPLPLDTWEFTGTGWTQIATGGPGRAFTGFVFDSHRNVGVLYGGAVVRVEILGDTQEWDGAQWTEKSLSGPGPGQRLFHAMAYDSKRKKVVLFGGADCSFCAVQKNDTWEYGLAHFEITSIERDPENGDIVLQWRGEAPPYQLQITTDLAAGEWKNLGEPTGELTMTVLSDADAAYFRIVSLFGAE